MSRNWQGSHSHGFPANVRRAILARDPQCRCAGCKHHNGRCTQPSTEADHILEVSDGGTDAMSNGQGLCSGCHAAKTLAHAISKQPRRKRPAEQHPGLRTTQGSGGTPLRDGTDCSVRHSASPPVRDGDLGCGRVRYTPAEGS